MLNYLLIKDNTGEYYVDMERKISVYVNTSGLGCSSISKIVDNWVPIDEYVNIDEKDFLNAYNDVMEKLRL